MPTFILRALLAAAMALPAAEPPWIEVVSLDRTQEPATMLPIASDGRSAPVPGTLAGWAVVCFGGDPGGISCAKRRLTGGERLARPAAPARAVVGRVVSGREGVPGAKVALFLAELEARRPHLVPLGRAAPPPRRLIHELDTATDGRFALPPLVAGDYRLEVTAPWGQRTSSSPFVVEVRPERGRQASPRPLDIGDVTLSSGVEVAAEVVDHQGRPIEGASVGLAQEEAGMAYFSGRTDVAGRVQLRGVDPAAPAAVSCLASGHAASRFRLAEPPPLVQCTLVAFAGLAGRVSADGEPLPAATMTLVGGPADETGRRARRTAAADEEGRFRFAAVKAGSYRLVAAAPGFLPAEVAVELAPGEARELELSDLLPGREVEGVVVATAGGEPVAGARIVSLDPAGAVAATSDAEGRFAWTPAGGRAVVLEVTADDFAATRLPVQPDAVDGEEPLVVRLERPGRIALLARNASGDPCVGCDFVAGLYALPDLPEMPSHRLRTDGQGRADSPPLPPGHYYVVRESVRSVGSGVTVRSGDDARDVRVSPGAVSEVEFVESPATIRVRAWPPLAPGWRLAAETAGGRKVYDADAASGIYRIDRPSDEEVSLELVTAGASVVLTRLPAGFDGDDLDLSIPRTRVVGRLVGGVEGGGVVELRALGLGPEAPRGWWAVGGEGHFELLHLPAGTYVLTADGRVVSTFTVADGQRVDLGELDLGG